MSIPISPHKCQRKNSQRMMGIRMQVRIQNITGKMSGQSPLQLLGFKLSFLSKIFQKKTSERPFFFYRKRQRDILNAHFSSPQGYIEKVFPPPPKTSLVCRPPFIHISASKTQFAERKSHFLSFLFAFCVFFLFLICNPLISIYWEEISIVAFLKTFPPNGVYCMVESFLSA